MKYRTIVNLVDAEQVPPLAISITEIGYAEKAQKIERFFDWLDRANIKYCSSTRLELVSGHDANAGQWVLKYEDSSLEVLSDIEFRQIYEVDDGLARSG